MNQKRGWDATVFKARNDQARVKNQINMVGLALMFGPPLVVQVGSIVKVATVSRKQGHIQSTLLRARILAYIHLP